MFNTEMALRNEGSDCIRSLCRHGKRHPAILRQPTLAAAQYDLSTAGLLLETLKRPKKTGLSLKGTGDRIDLTAEQGADIVLRLPGAALWCDKPGGFTA